MFLIGVAPSSGKLVAANISNLTPESSNCRGTVKPFGARAGGRDCGDEDMIPKGHGCIKVSKFLVAQKNPQLFRVHRRDFALPHSQ